jgi:hypothetical protein
MFVNVCVCLRIEICIEFNLLNYSTNISFLCPFLTRGLRSHIHYTFTAATQRKTRGQKNIQKKYKTFFLEQQSSGSSSSSSGNGGKKSISMRIIISTAVK